MEYVIGGIIGVVVTFIGFVVVMAPIHWENYHECKQLKEDNKILAKERDHFMHLTNPIEWGPQAQYESRIVPVKELPYEAVMDTKWIVPTFRFDDIKEGTE